MKVCQRRSVDFDAAEAHGVAVEIDARNPVYGVVAKSLHVGVGDGVVRLQEGVGAEGVAGGSPVLVGPPEAAQPFLAAEGRRDVLGRLIVLQDPGRRPFIHQLHLETTTGQPGRVLDAGEAGVVVALHRRLAVGGQNGAGLRLRSSTVSEPPSPRSSRLGPGAAHTGDAVLSTPRCTTCSLSALTPTALPQSRSLSPDSRSDNKLAPSFPASFIAPAPLLARARHGGRALP